jgi:hypothetical protein
VEAVVASSTSSSVARLPSPATVGFSRSISARVSLVPDRNSIGTATSARCPARSVEGLPDGCSGNAKKTRPRTPGSGAFACACDVIRPPNERPPANSLRSPPRRPASAAAARTCGMRHRRRVRPLAALLHVGELEAQHRDAPGL